MNHDDDAERFLCALAADLPEDERLILCGFVGDPHAAPQHAWRPRPWRPGCEIVLNERANGYVAVASFRRAVDGSFRRRAETFAAGRALMVDDVGTKIATATMANAPHPSAIIQTSPGNFQWWYFLREPEQDMARFDGVIRAFIQGRLLGADPGMSGVTRVGRLPGFVNGKPQHAGWVVRAESLQADVRYSVQELQEGFGLRIDTLRGRRDLRAILPGAEERVRAFYTVLRFLKMRGMLKRDDPDPSGWIPMVCPWTDAHTGRADTGAAVRIPAEENEFSGAYRCHHGHCADRRLRDLTEWAVEVAVEELAHAAQLAPEQLQFAPGAQGEAHDE